MEIKIVFDYMESYTYTLRYDFGGSKINNSVASFWGGCATQTPASSEIHYKI